MRLILDLTEREVELLRSSTSKLGVGEVDASRLQLKIVNAILDATAQKPTIRRFAEDT